MIASRSPGTPFLLSPLSYRVNEERAMEREFSGNSVNLFFILQFVEFILLVVVEFVFLIGFDFFFLEFLLAGVARVQGRERGRPLVPRCVGASWVVKGRK